MPKTDVGFDPNELSNDKETEANKDVVPPPMKGIPGYWDVEVNTPQEHPLTQQQTNGDSESSSSSASSDDASTDLSEAIKKLSAEVETDERELAELDRVEESKRKLQRLRFNDDRSDAIDIPDEDALDASNYDNRLPSSDDSDSLGDIYGPPSPEPGPVPDEVDVPTMSPRKTRSGKIYHEPAASRISIKRSPGPLYRAVKSRLFSHIRAISDERNLVYATLDWENVPQNSMYQYFDRIFNMHVDPKTKELLNPDMIHPFALSAKLESEDYPSFKEILKMPPEERAKWFDSMDEELRALFEMGACEFVDRDEVTTVADKISHLCYFRFH